MSYNYLKTNMLKIGFRNKKRVAPWGMFPLAVAMIFLFAQAYAAEKGWRELRSTHFIVYYKKAPSDFINQVSNRAEYYYSSIANELGFARFDFWLWDNRAKIFVYDDAAQYQAASGGPGWSGAQTVIEEKAIYTFAGNKQFTDTILPHELGHIIFREFVGFKNPAIPVWLDEGVAQYQENLENNTALPLVKEAMAKGKFIPLEQLSRMTPWLLGDNTGMIALFYAESATVVMYLVREFGKGRFVDFCRNLRDKRDFEAAISATYRFDNLKELDQRWQEYLKR